MDVIKYILENIPYWIEEGGETYQFILFPNHSYDFRFCYSNEFANPSFLYLTENISSQEELLRDLTILKDLLKKDGKIK